MTNFDFKDRTALVTGGSRGIGRAIAEMILQAEGKVIITSTGQRPDWLDDYSRARHMTLDFLKEDAIPAFIDSFPAEKDIHVLINNAGIHIPKYFNEMTQQEWERILRVNLTGPVHLTKALLPFMPKKQLGHILNISSVAGLIARPGSCAYSVSKAGLIGFTRCLALEMSQHNILVNALCPGTTETDMVKNLMDAERRAAFMQLIPLKRFAQPDEIAAMALFLCSSLNTYITGQTIIVDGGVMIK